MPRQSERKQNTILHFCNDRMILTIRGWVLNQMGYEVINSATSRDAVRAARRQRINAVLIDLDETADEALVVAKEIKKDHPQVPILLLADENQPTDEIRDLADTMISRLANIDIARKALAELIAGGAERSTSRRSAVVH